MISSFRTPLELLHARQRLRLMNNEKNEFLGIAAHDLRSPLTAKHAPRIPSGFRSASAGKSTGTLLLMIRHYLTLSFYSGNLRTGMKTRQQP